MNEHPTRIYGLDAFRCLAAFLVVLVHSTKITVCPEGSWEELIMRFFGLLSLCCVNCFGVLTGYLGGPRHHRLESFAKLWCQVLFYIMIVFALVNSGCITGCEKFRAFKLLPVNGGMYWYFTGYAVVAALLPVLQYGVEKISKTEFRLLLGGLLLFYVVPSACPWGPDKTLGAYYGFSAIWLLVLYLTGAYIRKYPEDFRKFSIGLSLLIALGLPLFGSVLYHAYYCWGAKRLLDLCMVRNLFCVALYDVRHGEYAVMYYTQPILFLESVFLLIAFSKMELKRYGKFFMKLSPFAFGIYLAHCNDVFTPLIREPFLEKLLKFPIALFPFLTLAAVVLMYFGCALFDWMRQKFFELIRLPVLIRKLSERF